MASATSGSVRERCSIVRMLLPIDLADARQVAAAGERGVEPDLEDLLRLAFRQRARAEREHVRVVVLAAEPRRLLVPGQRRAHAAMAVGGHGHALPAAADEHASFRLAPADR